MVVPLLLLLLVVGGGSGRTQAEPAALYVSPAGSDDGRCTRSSPCATFDRAYRVARCGQVVEVAAGHYPAQQVNYDSSKESCRLGRRVVFRPARRAVVQVAQIRVGGGDGPGGLLAGSPGGHHVQFERFSVTTMVSVTSASDVAYVQIRARTFYVNGGKNVLVRGGNYGPCTASRDPLDVCQQNRIEGPSGPVTIDGAYLHDYRISHPDDHYECLLVFGAAGLTVRNSRFANCEFFNILISTPRSVPLHSIRIEGNWFGTPWDGQGNKNRGTGVGFNEPLPNSVVRANSFEEQAGLVESLTGKPGDGTFTVVGNVLGSRHGCHPGVAYRRNVRIASAPCGPTDRTVPWGYSAVGGSLQPIPAAATTVRRLFSQTARGRSLRATVRELRARRAPAPAGASWTVSLARQILRDRAYVGGQWGARASHKPIVTARVWNAAQRRLGG